MQIVDTQCHDREDLDSRKIKLILSVAIHTVDHDRRDQLESALKRPVNIKLRGELTSKLVVPIVTTLSLKISDADVKKRVHLLNMANILVPFGDVKAGH